MTRFNVYTMKLGYADFVIHNNQFVWVWALQFLCMSVGGWGEGELWVL